MADTIERLKELKEMLDSGLITQTEFDELKAKELGTDTSVGNGFDKGQQTDSMFVNQGGAYGNNSGKKRGKGCLIAFLIVVVIVIGFIVLTNTLVDQYAEENPVVQEVEDQEQEQEIVVDLEQIIDVESYYNMSIDDFVALHGEPNSKKEISEGEITYHYDEFRASFSSGECDIFTYLAGAEIEEMEDAFVLFGIVPDESTMEAEWWDSTNGYFIKNINDKIEFITIDINKSDPNYVDLFRVTFID